MFADNRKMKMENKKGLSDIVATVLIVLLALAAVAIVWGFLRPVFTNAASTTSLRSQCISVDVQPTVCNYNDNTGTGTIAITARVRNMAGEARYITAVVNNKDGSTYTSWTYPAVELLGTDTFTYTNMGAALGNGALTDFTVAGVVTDDAGNNQTCPGTTIACTGVGYP